ncbi:hypothetical protein [Micromonospora sp. NBC_00898]
MGQLDVARQLLDGKTGE